MTQVDAVYQNGVFKPLGDVRLPENQRVRLSVHPLDAEDARAWLARVQQHQQRLIVAHGYFPDSAADIAEDRAAMSDTVVDSSVVAKWLLPEADSAHAQRLISEVAFKGQRLIALDLVLAEVTNAIWKRFHRSLATLDDTRQLLDDLLHCPIHLEPTVRLLKPALEIAVKYDRAIYDALFVALAQDLGFPSITADEPLHDAVHTEIPQIILLRNWN